jgi:quinol monooxygenase YgiN
MITEIASITIDPANAADFEDSVARASREVHAQAHGCRAMRLERVVGSPSEYRLFVDWDSVSDHRDTFRKSPLFLRWRELAGRYFVGTPEVVHVETVARYF